MTEKYTPGPWAARKSTIGEHRYDITARANSNWDGASVMWTNDPASANGDDEQEARANAHLVAAAPTLLAACEAAEDALWHVAPGSHAETLDNVRAAIARAKGDGT